MSSLTLPYPPMPTGADKSIIKPSASFKKKVYQAIGAIVLFIVSYILLFACAVGIAVLFGFLGVGLMALKLHWLTLVLGLGLIGSGIMLVFFVVKFLFKSNVQDSSDMIELSRDEQPALFEFIQKITEETNAPAPKRIYISADVNAGVFYDSSFWSMFFPVKKNLKIGLGLVNCINVSEFKAIMAHEFGHFSQRSMKFGSYVYNFNKVIHNMLYDNEGYVNALNSVAKIHNVLALVAWLNVKIIRAMQYMLQQVYIVLNKSHLSLSREMEFHADAVAAYVSGSNNLVTSLKRTEIGQTSYNRLLEYLNNKLTDDQRSANVYPQQLELIRFYADSRSLHSDESGLPVIEKNLFMADEPEIVIKDQWSSHPSTEDREAALNKINLITAAEARSAWVLFNNAEELQQLLTKQLYAGVTRQNVSAFIELEDFKADFYKDVIVRALDKRYKGYYDDRNVNPFDVDEATETSAQNTLVFDDLFSNENTSMPKVIDRAFGDMMVLEQVITYREDIKTFDYKGRKFGRDQAQEIYNLIEQERNGVIIAMEALDKNIFIYFYEAAKAKGMAVELAGRYKQLFAYQEMAVKDYEQYNDVMQAFNPVYESHPHAKIRENLAVLYDKEKELKPRIRELLTDEGIGNSLSAEQLAHVVAYLDKDHIYFPMPGTEYDQEAINAFNNGTSAYINAVSKRHFELKKDLLTYQINIINPDLAI